MMAAIRGGIQLKKPNKRKSIAVENPSELGIELPKLRPIKRNGTIT